MWSVKFLALLARICHFKGGKEFIFCTFLLRPNQDHPQRRHQKKMTGWGFFFFFKETVLRVLFFLFFLFFRFDYAQVWLQEVDNGAYLFSFKISFVYFRLFCGYFMALKKNPNQPTWVTFSMIKGLHYRFCFSSSP